MTLRRLQCLGLIIVALVFGAGGGLLQGIVEARTRTLLMSPTLQLNNTQYCTGTLQNTWAMEVNGATPNSGVYLEEYRYSGGWQLQWAGNVGTTDGAGNFGYVTRPPDVEGDYYAIATVDGQQTNPWLYYSSYSYC